MYKDLIPELLKKLFDFQNPVSKKPLLVYESLAILFFHRRYIPVFLKLYGQHHKWIINPPREFNFEFGKIF